MAIDIEQLRADMEGGTPGPWEALLNGGRWDNYVGGPSVGYDGDFELPADARRIARLPDLEAEYLRLREENDKLREGLKDLHKASEKYQAYIVENAK